MVQKSVVQYAHEKLAPRVVDMYREENIDRTIFAEMGKLGVLAPMLEGYGCPGMGYAAYGVIARKIERIDSGFRSMMSVQSSLVMYPIYSYGSV